MYGHLSPRIESAYGEGVRECSLLGKQKTNMGRLLEKRTLAFKKNKNKTNAALQSPRNKQIGERKGAETYSAIIWGLYGCCLLPESKRAFAFLRKKQTERYCSVALPMVAKSIMATLQKREGSLWHTQGRHFDALEVQTIILSFRSKKRLYGQNRHMWGAVLLPEKYCLEPAQAV